MHLYCCFANILLESICTGNNCDNCVYLVFHFENKLLQKTVNIVLSLVSHLVLHAVSKHCSKKRKGWQRFFFFQCAALFPCLHVS